MVRDSRNICIPLLHQTLPTCVLEEVHLSVEHCQCKISGEGPSIVKHYVAS